MFMTIFLAFGANLDGSLPVWCVSNLEPKLIIKSAFCTAKLPYLLDDIPKLPIKLSLSSVNKSIVDHVVTKGRLEKLRKSFIFSSTLPIFTPPPTITTGLFALSIEFIVSVI